MRKCEYMCALKCANVNICAAYGTPIQIFEHSSGLLQNASSFGGSNEWTKCHNHKVGTLWFCRNTVIFIVFDAQNRLRIACWDIKKGVFWWLKCVMIFVCACLIALCAIWEDPAQTLQPPRVYWHALHSDVNRSGIASSDAALRQPQRYCVKWLHHCPAPSQHGISHSHTGAYPSKKGFINTAEKCCFIPFLAERISSLIIWLGSTPKAAEPLEKPRVCKGVSMQLRLRYSKKWCMSCH